MRGRLAKRRQNGSLRTPKPIDTFFHKAQSGVDFSSNDYLGLARCHQQKETVGRLVQEQTEICLGATGSRLLSGDSLFARNLEVWLAKLHQRQTATIFNSGYDANLSILSSIIEPGDLVILDELCHNSAVMGVRMSRQREFRVFPHNDMNALRILLEKTRFSHKCCLIVVESVYSMDGDVAPLNDVLDLALRHGAHVVVDEAHGLGIYGRTNRNDLEVSRKTHDGCQRQERPTSNRFGGTGVLAALELESHPALLASVHTFGKAAGCHGAVICGSDTLRDFLWNYARPFVYSTSLPLHSLVTIKAAYMTMTSIEGDVRRAHTFHLVKQFCSIMNEALSASQLVSLWPSPSPIQALVLGDNDTCLEFCQRILDQYAIRLYAIRAPTVPKGLERVRVILHAHNTEDEVQWLCQALLRTCCEMRLLTASRM